MSDRVAFLDGRAFPRVALTGVALLWLAGCSSDMSRLEMSSNPFANPFNAQTAAATAPGAAPAGQVAAAPLAPPQAIASAPLPSVASAPAMVASRAAGGSAAGWSAAGGAPITVGEGETLDTVSRRYGVPASALLAANGLSSAAEVKGGTRMIVPVYNAGGRAVAAAAPAVAAETSSKTEEERRSRIAATASRAPTRRPPRRTRPTARATKRSPTRPSRRRRPPTPSPRPRIRRSRRPILPNAAKRPGDRRDADRQRRSEGWRESLAHHRRTGRRRRGLTGIPLAGARPHHPGLQDRRQRRDQHLGAGRHLGARRRERRRRLFGRRAQGLRQSGADQASERLRLGLRQQRRTRREARRARSSAARSSPSPATPATSTRRSSTSNCARARRRSTRPIISRASGPAGCRGPASSLDIPNSRFGDLPRDTFVFGDANQGGGSKERPAALDFCLANGDGKR